MVNIISSNEKYKGDQQKNLKWITLPLETSNVSILKKKIQDLKQTDGEGWAIGEIIERLLPYLDFSDKGNELVTICDQYLTASCVQYAVICNKSQYSGTIQKTKEELRRLKYEHESY